jgi:hypothetical protein
MGWCHRQRQRVVYVKRVTSLLFSFGLFTMLFTGAALATPPTHERSSDVFDFDLGEELCGFPLLAHVEQDVTLTTFYDAEGNPVRSILRGPITVAFTNGATGETVRLSIPGPSFFDAEGNLIRGTGTWATFTSDGTLVWAAGNIIFDEFGNASEITGRSVSVCDLL